MPIPLTVCPTSNGATFPKYNVLPEEVVFAVGYAFACTLVPMYLCNSTPVPPMVNSSDILLSKNL
jgi:hypothetical protein